MVIPAAALTVLEGYAGLGYGLIAGVLTFAGIDAMISRRMLEALTVSGPATVRLWQNREGSFDLTILHPRKRRMELRFGVPFREAIRAQTEETNIMLPADAEQAQLPWN